MMGFQFIQIFCFLFREYIWIWFVDFGNRINQVSSLHIYCYIAFLLIPSFFCYMLHVVIFLGFEVNGELSMYVLCPPQFIAVGEKCYFISKERVNWLDAHFECKERNSRLAEPTRKEDRLLRKHLNKLNGLNLGEMWIGARFNWERNKWQWGYNGEDLTYQSFSQMSA